MEQRMASGSNTQLFDLISRVYDHDGAMRRAEDFLGDTAYHGPIKSGPTVGSDNNQIHIPFFGQALQCCRRMTFNGSPRGNETCCLQFGEVPDARW